MIKSKIEYNQLIKDLSGSIVQNRFKFQKFWTINKIYELYKSNKEFIVIFDFVSDIDIFIDKDLHFYQVKTDKNKKFTIKRLIEVKKLNNHSILSKLALLENYKSVKSLNIVSNKFLSEKDKNGKELEILCLNNLKEETKKQIKFHIQEQITVTPNLSKYFYIKSDLCLDSSYITLLGHTVKFLEENFNTNETRATLFLNWLLKEAEEKSTYEHNVDDAIIKKGITKEQFLKLLKDYNSTNNKILEHVNQIINNNDNIYESYKLSSALTELTRNSLESIRNKNSLEQIRKYILKNEIKLSVKNIEDIIKDIEEKNIFELDSGYSDYEKKCLIIIAVVQFKKGVN